MSYSTTTVKTSIPLSAIRPVHRLLLEAMDYQVLEQHPQSSGDGQATVYIFADDPAEPLNFSMLSDETQQAIKDLADSETLASLAYNDPQQADVRPVTIELRDILQDILDGVPEAVLKHIDAITTFRGEKASRGDHGGTAMRIQRDQVRSVDTVSQFTLWDIDAANADYDGMHYLLRGPIDGDHYLYWNMSDGWVSKETATPIAHKDMPRGLLLMGLTGVEVVREPDPGVEQRDAALDLKVAVQELGRHGIEAMTVLVASTAHLSPEEAAVLNGSCGAGTTLGNDLTVSFDGEYGWIFWVSHEDPSAYDGLSDGLKGAVNYAREHGIDWLRLDQDGDELPDIVTYRW